MAAVVAVVAAVAFQDDHLGWVIALAMVINLMVAAVAGRLLPSILMAMNIDPGDRRRRGAHHHHRRRRILRLSGLATWAYA